MPPASSAPSAPAKPKLAARHRGARRALENRPAEPEPGTGLTKTQRRNLRRYARQRTFPNEPNPPELLADWPGVSARRSFRGGRPRPPGHNPVDLKNEATFGHESAFWEWSADTQPAGLEDFRPPPTVAAPPPDLDDSVILSFLNAPQLDPFGPDVFGFGETPEPEFDEPEFFEEPPKLVAEDAAEEELELDVGQADPGLRPLTRREADRIIALGPGATHWVRSAVSVAAAHELEPATEAALWMSAEEKKLVRKLYDQQVDRANAQPPHGLPFGRPAARPREREDAPAVSDPPPQCICGILRFSADFCAAPCGAQRCLSLDPHARQDVETRVEEGLGLLRLLSESRLASCEASAQSPASSSRSGSLSPPNGRNGVCADALAADSVGRKITKLFQLVTLHVSEPLLVDGARKPALVWPPGAVSRASQSLEALTWIDKGLRLISGTWLACITSAKQSPALILAAIFRSFPYLTVMCQRSDCQLFALLFHPALKICLSTRNKASSVDHEGFTATHNHLKQDAPGPPHGIALIRQLQRTAAGALTANTVRDTAAAKQWPGHTHVFRHWLLAMVNLSSAGEEVFLDVAKRRSFAESLLKHFLEGYIDALRAPDGVLASHAATADHFFVSHHPLLSKLLESGPLLCLMSILFNILPAFEAFSDEKESEGQVQRIVDQGERLFLERGDPTALAVEDLIPRTVRYLVMVILCQGAINLTFRHGQLQGRPSGETAEDALGSDSLVAAANLLFTFVHHGSADSVAAAVLKMAVQRRGGVPEAYLMSLHDLFPVSTACLD